jgi:hypothetical protein
MARNRNAGFRQSLSKFKAEVRYDFTESASVKTHEEIAEHEKARRQGAISDPSAEYMTKRGNRSGTYN